MASPRTVPTGAVLAGCDGSDEASRAIRWAAREAASRGSDLVIVESVEPSAPWVSDSDDRIAEHEEKRSALARECAADNDGLVVHLHVVHGRARETIPEVIAELSPALLVLGASGATGISRLVLGSTADALIRSVPIPVVIARGGTGADSHAPVVAGLDGTDASDRAVQFAVEFAARRDSPLVVVHAVAGPLEAGTATEEMVRMRIDRLQEGHPPVETRIEIVEDRAARALMNQAEGARLLVVGTHGRGLIDRLILGSVSHAVVGNSSCPVALVQTGS